MSKHLIEVELRGPLTAESQAHLVEYLVSRGCEKRFENRVFIDYSTLVEGVATRNLDVRVRMTNSKPEIVVKRGKFAGDYREEAVAPVGTHSLDSAVRVMALLGYRRGVLCDRAITRFQLGTIEVAIQEVRIIGTSFVHSMFFEIEFQNQLANPDEAAKTLREFANEVALPLFSSDDWTRYVELINVEANGIFDFDSDSLDRLVGLGMEISAQRPSP